MSSNILAQAERQILEAVSFTLMAQWRALGGGAAGRPARAVVDPEALLLTSLALSTAEPRLELVAEDWVRHGARYLSTQRFKNLRKVLRYVSDASVTKLARVAVDEAGDGRWKTLGGAGRSARVRESSVRRRTTELQFRDFPTLMLRLRAAFGVGVKADLLGFLLTRPVPTSVIVAARALAVSQPSIFRAMQDLVTARFVEPVERSSATEYRIDPAKWMRVLGYTEWAEWRPWKEVFGFTLALTARMSEMEDRPVSEYAAATTIRSLAEDWSSRATRAGMEPAVTPPPTLDNEGVREFVRGFEQRLEAWT